MFDVVFRILLLVIYMCLPRLGKRELICLLLFTCNYVVSLSRCFLYRLVFEIDRLHYFTEASPVPSIKLFCSFLLQFIYENMVLCKTIALHVAVSRQEKIASHVRLCHYVHRQLKQPMGNVLFNIFLEFRNFSKTIKRNIVPAV